MEKTLKEGEKKEKEKIVLSEPVTVVKVKGASSSKVYDKWPK